MDMLFAFLKRPSTYVLLAIGAVLALAYASFFAFIRPLAKSLPRSEA